MSSRTTHFLLAALVALTIFSLAMQQHQARESQRLLTKLIARLDTKPVEVAVAGPAAIEPVAVDPAPAPAPALQVVEPAAELPSLPDSDPVEPEAAIAEVPGPAPAVEPEVDPTYTAAASPSTPTEAQSAVDQFELAWNIHGETVTQIIRQLLDGEYSQVVAQFNEDMAAALNEQRVASVMDPIRRDHGPLRRVIAHAPPAVELPRHLHAFVVTVETRTNSNLIFTITLDANKRIAGLYVK